MSTLMILGDSQGAGLEPFMDALASRHGLTFDRTRSYTRAGASLEELTEHAVHAGPASLAIVFSGGGNDPAALVNNQTLYAEKLATLVGTLRFAGVQSVVVVGPFRSDDAAVQAQHEAARLVQGRGIPGARWVDGMALTAFVPHPADNETHWDRASYARIATELEKAIFDQGLVTAIGMVGTLAFLGAGGVVVMELLYARAAGDVG